MSEQPGPMQEPDAPDDKAVISTLLQELAQANDQRIYLKAQVAHLRAKLAEATAVEQPEAPADTEGVTPTQPEE